MSFEFLVLSGGVRFAHIFYELLTLTESLMNSFFVIPAYAGMTE
jgi:hypothetical protein